MEYINNILSSPNTWLLWAVVVFVISFLIDAMDHGLFVGGPAFLMPLFCYWVSPELFILLIYTVITAIFYYYSGYFRDWFHGTSDDINNDDYDDYDDKRAK